MNHFDAGHNAEIQARELGAHLRDAALRDATVEHLDDEAERLRRAVSQIGLGRRSADLRLGRAAWLLAATAVLSVAVLWFGLRHTRELVPLTFEVLGPGQVSSSYVETPDSASALLKFTDGSTVVAHQATRLKVSELRMDGATLVIGRGKATVEVVHRAHDTRWNVIAGPFTIAVTGTKFVVEWIPSDGRFTVDMLEGRVEVDGPKFTAPATLRSGQRVEANASAEKWAVTPSALEHQAQLDAIATPATSASPNAPRAAAVVVGPTRDQSPRSVLSSVINVNDRRATGLSAGPVTKLPVAPAGEVKSWASMVALGESPRVVLEAEAMGLKSCVDRCSSSDLRALADAARYSGRLDLAEASLRTLRERYPNQAAIAAYLLGTVDEARGRNASALRWYEEYVAAAPNGGFSAEALAGRLRMLVVTNGNTSARKAAQQYLELYPRGVGARTAKQILERR